MSEAKTQPSPLLESLEPRLLLSAVDPAGGIEDPSLEATQPSSVIVDASRATGSVSGRDDYGDRAGEARQMSFGKAGLPTALGSIGTSGDEDWFTFKAATSQTVRLRMDGVGVGALYGAAHVLDATNRWIAGHNRACGGGEASVLEFDVQAGKTYYLRTLSMGGTIGGYRVLLEGEFVRPASDRGPAPAPKPAPAPVPDDPPAPPAPAPQALVYQPGQEVVAAVQTVNGVRYLVVSGTAGNDRIAVSYAQNQIVVSTADGQSVHARDVAEIHICGFGGNDQIRTAYGVRESLLVLAGGGNDSIFEASIASSRVYGGEGADRIVLVGGGRDRAWGGGQADAYWVDGTDPIEDLDAGEGDVAHRIEQFYQPYTTDPSQAGYVPLNIAGQDLRDPQITGYASGYADFADRPLFSGLSYDDSDQGALGDCYFLAVLSSLAESDPAEIRKAIAPLGDGTFVVRFFRGGKWEYLRIDAELPVRSGGSLVYAGLGAGGDIWMGLMEKAYAYFRTGDNSYSSLSGGWMTTVYTEVTGRGASTLVPSSYTAAGLYSTLAQHMSAGHALSAGSKDSSGTPIVASHAYVIHSLSTIGGIQYVTVYNPWGWDGSGDDGNSSDGLIRIQAGMFANYFTGICVSMA
jgi:hypothetical protein